EGDWIAAARDVVGPRCFLSASYDLHGNLSRRIIDSLDMLTAYRTAPHIDVFETMQRAYRMLVRCLREQIRPKLVWVPIPVLMPGERSSTMNEPAKSLYDLLPEANEQKGVLDASLLVGYVWADEERATASAAITGTDEETAITEGSKLGTAYWAARDQFQFGVPVGTIAQCLDEAQKAQTQPVILADSGDNPTGGGVGDRAEVLAEVLKRKLENVLFAGIADEGATQACYLAGVGQPVSLSIGATLDPLGSEPILVSGTVEFVLPEVAPAEREAVLRIGGVTVVLTARRRPFHNLSDFVRLGLDPKTVKLLVVKSGYLSPELAPIANPNLMALSDGSINQNIEGLPANVHRRPTYPFVKDFTWQPEAIISAHA
ncbi:MAG: M81 family metallopeptidase, partial [Rhodospirillales bacterium]|nr:M81 family metallopeptidase [Acetobacter sp.]